MKIILDGPGPQTCPIPKSYISTSNIDQITETLYMLHSAGLLSIL